jgi:hypothetical protein
MKKFTIVISLILLNSFALFSQEDMDTSPKPERHIIRMGGAGGFTPLVLFWNVKNINQSISSEISFPKFKDQPLVLLGGQGYGYIMFIENLRIGGMGAGGGQSSSVIGGDGYERDADIDVSFGGVTCEYVIPVAERLDIVPGIMLGGGGIDLNLRRDKYGPKEWNELIDELEGNNPIENFRKTFEGSFFIYQPSLNVEYALLKWVGIRFGVSYLGMLYPSWKVDEVFKTAGVPDKLNGSGVMFNAGIFLGTFLF